MVTGMGVVSCLGSTLEQTWSAIVEGRSGLGTMSELEQRPNPDKGGGQAVDLPADFFPELPRAARYLRFAVEHALQMRGTLLCPPARRGAIFGTTLHGMRAGGRFFRGDDPTELRDFLAGSVIDRALRGLDICGPRFTTCSACSSGLSAIGLAATLLRSGELDLVVAGGYDCVSEYSYAGFDSLRLIASGIPMPFAAERDGLKVAEGYGVLVLERAPDAAANKTAAIACIAGAGESSDAFHLTQPHPEGSGAAHAIRAALTESGVGPDDIDMIAAHGTATPNNDAAEYAALSTVFGDSLSSKPVVALKSHLGHTLGGAGAVELALSSMARRNSLIPPTAGGSAVDPKFGGLSLVRGKPLARPVRTSLNISLGFGGANASVVLTESPRINPAPKPEESEVVVTGVGVVVPRGVGNSQFLELLSSPGRQDLGADTGPLPESEYAHLLNTRRARRMSEYVKLSLAAATAACDDAGAGQPAFLENCSAILGTTHGASPFCEAFYSQIVREGMSAANPVLFAEGVPNVAGAHLTMTFGIKGGCQTIIGTRCAGLDALRLATLRIRQGRWKRALVGAAEEYSPVVNRAYQACGLYGGDTNRYPNRFVTGSGAVMLMLESRDSALERGARVRGVVEAGAWSADADKAAKGADALHRIESTRPVESANGRIQSNEIALPKTGEQPPFGQGAVNWSVQRFLPELFSVGPLASLAGVLLGAPAAGEAADQGNQTFAIRVNEFSGASTSIRVRRSL